MAFAKWGKAVPGVAVLLLALTGCVESADGGANPAVSPLGAPPGSSAQSTSATPISAPTASPVASGTPPTDSASTTDVVSLIAVDTAGRPINGFTLPDAELTGELDCRDGTPSRSADTPGIYHCGASADMADVCWPTPTRTELLCAGDPWLRELRRYTVDPPLEPIGATADPEPWALDLADGRTCRIRVGGAWGGRSDGLVGAYSCTGGAEVVLQPSDARTAIDRSAGAWRVAMGELGAGAPEFPAPTMVDVRTAYFAAAS
ncbi:hypothetical protein [Nocardia sp. NBC_00416]|uniref:hypothetical protein n=1 Tax=Nocardia sp. NBC_00416 TaxID=2975991 RepID=UPI002E20CD9F